MSENRLAHQLIGDRYELLEPVGRGGFGVVWRALDTLLQRHVAVKEIHIPGFLGDEDRAHVRDKVLREARAAARLDHPGAVTVFDVIDDDGRPVIVMELVNAPNLAELVAQSGPLAPSEVARIGLEVLEVLVAAHERGIVHRDVKPANVMVSDSGRVRLGDFGVAAILDDPTIATSGTVTGSPAYMAPEQATNTGAVAESDLWALGATLYFAVEGRPPFDKGSPLPTLTSIVRDPPRPPTRAGALGPVIEGLLVKDPAERLAPTELRDRLTAIARGAVGVAPVAPIVRAPLGGGPFDDTTMVVERDDVVADTGLPTVAAVEPDRPRVPVPAMAATAVDAAPPAVRRPPARRLSAAPGPHRPGRGRLPGTAIAGLVGVVVLALVAVALVTGRSSTTPPSPGPAAAPSPSTTAGAGAGRTVPGGRTPTTVAPASTAGWVPYADQSTGFTISQPSNWTVRTAGTLTDFRDPDTGAYLRVDHIQPPGASPEGAWLTLEKSFSAQNANYNRIRIEPTTYAGYRAAIWDFTYSAGGADLRVADLGFITPRYGFALYFQTRAADWDRMQPILQAFKNSFKAPA